MMTRKVAAAGLAALVVACGGGPGTPLGEAAASGDRQAVIRLLAEGADPNELDARGWSALVWAVRNGHHGLVGILADRGAALDQPAADGAGWTPLMHAIAHRELDAVRALLNAGADPNVAASGGGRTPLMLAAAYGYFRTTRVLLTRGADPTLRSSSGETALELAVTGVLELDHITAGACQTETVRALVAAMPDRKLADDSWALRSARFKRCGEIVDLVGGA